MKYFIFGINGMAGHTIALYLKEQGHKVVGFAQSQSQICNSVIVGSVSDVDMVKRALHSDNYHVVINCVGILNKAVDKDITNGIYINSLFPHLVADYISSTKAILIHISTDCVFSGNRGKYYEECNPDEFSLYGRTKALGEVIDKKNLTFRTSIIGPELKKDGIGLFHWFMNQKDSIFGYKRVMWSGVTTLQLAKAIEVASEQNLTGLYHLSNNISISKYELLQLMNDYCRGGEMIIKADEKLVSDKSLINTRTDFLYSVPSYEKMLEEMSVWIRNHRHLYTQYESFR